MASKRRLRRKACDGKAKHERDGAVIAAGIARKRSGHYIVSYKCRFCGKYHIGHPPSSVRKALSLKK